MIYSKKLVITQEINKYEMDLAANYALEHQKTDMVGNTYYPYNFMSSLDSEGENVFITEFREILRNEEDFHNDAELENTLALLMQIYCVNLGYFEPIRKGFDIAEWNWETALYHWVHLFLWFKNFREVAIAVGEMEYGSFSAEDIYHLVATRKVISMSEKDVEKVLEIMVELEVLENIDGYYYHEAGKIFSKDIEPKARDYLKLVLGAINKKAWFNKYEYRLFLGLKPSPELQAKVDDMRNKEVSECLPERESDLAKAFSPFWYLLDEVENEDIS